MTQLKKEGLTAQEVADELGVTKQTVYNWLRIEGLQHVDTPRGKIIKLRDLIDWHVSRAHKDSVKPVKFSPTEEVVQPPETYEDALARKTRAEADLKELQLAKERGLVAAIADVEKILSAANMATQTQILAVPSRLATQMLGLEDHGRAVAILSAEMRQLLSNLASIDAVRESAGAKESEADDE